MKKHFAYIVWVLALISAGCSSSLKEDKFIGVWINEEEKCIIHLNRDFTFTSTNLPIDVVNKYYLTFDKKTKVWHGYWSIQNKQLKLTVGDSYYYLDINTLLLNEPEIYVQLSDESGGDLIFFDKQ